MVYLGNDLRLQRRVAIKIMHQHLAEDENFTRRFEQEARSAAMLGHANVVGMFDQGVSGGVPYLVMEHLPGITLRDLLRQQKQLTTEQALEIGEAVLGGLAAAHSAGIVHRDLKPENVLLADDGRIKIGDFGLARAVSANTTTGQALLGTIAYLSPELVTRGVADARSDIYAFGIMMFEMLTGQQPFQGEQAMQIAYQHAHSDVAAPSTVNPQVSPELDELVRWATQRDPELRPVDATEALDFVREIRSGVPLGSTRVLPLTGIIGVTPSTTVLSQHEQGSLAASVSAAEGTASLSAATPSRAAASRSATSRVSASARRRSRRGRWVGLVLTLLIALAGGVGWWWGQGPGSQVTIPDVQGQSPAAAQEQLELVHLVVEHTECSSLSVTAGLVAQTAPQSGAHVDRGTAVQLCISTGPRELKVPMVVGLPLGTAQEEIEKGGFVFGSVIEERFDGGTPGIVIAALDENGDDLAERHVEQGRIDFVVSAGWVPDVAGLSVETATQRLSDAGLAVDSSFNREAHHDDIAEGDVITDIWSTDSLRVGDAVGLEISLGPELFPVPGVSGLSLEDAMFTLSNAGFSPTHVVPELLSSLATATGTTPAEGEMLPLGTALQIRATINL